MQHARSPQYLRIKQPLIKHCIIISHIDQCTKMGESAV